MKRIHGSWWLCLCLCLWVGCDESESDSATEAPEDMTPDAAMEEPEGPPPPDYSGLLEQDCDPLVPSVCAMPFPSNVYLHPDPTGFNPSGLSVRFGETSLPATLLGKHFDPADLYDLDGFSPASSPMTHMPGATETGLATPDTIGDSLSDSSPTVLLDTETGERVAHFVDLDASAEEGSRALLLRPIVGLEPGRRYIVAIRNVVDADGTALPAGEVFAALRDDTEHSEPSVATRRDHYADIFEHLSTAGVSRDDLQLAWDFTTGTREGVTRWLVGMRDDALAQVGEMGPEYVIKEVEADPNDRIKYRVTVTMTVPLYLSHGDFSTSPPALLNMDDSGMPRREGTMEQDVQISIPVTIDNGERHGLLQNGHGLFGGMGEGRNGYLADIAGGWGWVAFATDFFGFSGSDVPVALMALSGGDDGLRSFVQRQMQGHVNQLLAMRMMMGRIATEGLTDADGTVLLAPEQVDRELRAYRGDSQGGIMGAAYMALSTDVTRGLLGEPGMPYGVLLNRSVDWPSYGAVLAGTYGTGLPVQMMLGVIQLGWDRAEPSGYADAMTDDPLPNTPPHHVLLHAALGDHQVSTLATHILARTIGAKLLLSDDPDEPLLRSIYGLEEVSGPLTDTSALVEYDFALAKEPLTNIPPTDGCDPHDRVRMLTPSFEQQDTFFRTGRIEWTCDGVCNCDGPRAEGRCEESYARQCE